MEVQQKLLVAKALDAIRISGLRNIPKFVGFLSPGEASAIKQGIGNNPSTFFFGGYDGAERTVFGVLPDYLGEDLTAFPVTALQITFNENFLLSHSDVLGALMSSGVDRSTVGDILISSGQVIVFVLEEMAEYFINQIDKIRNIGVSIKKLENLKNVSIIHNPKREAFSFTVSSLRLDAVVSGLTGIGRSKSEQLIADGLVFINSFEALKPTKKVQQGDILTVRRYGKFKIAQTGALSKKGREIISAEKYI